MSWSYKDTKKLANQFDKEAKENSTTYCKPLVLVCKSDAKSSSQMESGGWARINNCSRMKPVLEEARSQKDDVGIVSTTKQMNLKSCCQGSFPKCYELDNSEQDGDSTC